MQVRLARYPCVMSGACLHRYRAHAAHVTAVQWLSQGKRVISAGGRDACVLQWRVKRKIDGMNMLATEQSDPCGTAMASSAQFDYDGNDSLAAGALCTLGNPADSLSGHHRIHGGLNRSVGSLKSGSFKLHHNLRYQHESAKRVPLATTTPKLPQGTDRSLSWASETAGAEAKTNALIHSMRTLGNAQTELDWELKQLSRFSR